MCLTPNICLLKSCRGHTSWLAFIAVSGQTRDQVLVIFGNIERNLKAEEKALLLRNVLIHPRFSSDHYSFNIALIEVYGSIEQRVENGFYTINRIFFHPKNIFLMKFVKLHTFLAEVLMKAELIRNFWRKLKWNCLPTMNTKMKTIGSHWWQELAHLLIFALYVIIHFYTLKV